MHPTEPTDARLYKLFLDRNAPGQWVLFGLLDATGADLEYVQRQPLEDPGEITVLVDHPGAALDVSFVDPGLVVTEAVGALLEALAADDVRRFPARVQSMPGRYEFVNVVPWLDCIDPDRTLYDVIIPSDPVPLTKGTMTEVAPLLARKAAGEDGVSARMTRLRLKTDGIHGARIFWVEGRGAFPIVTEPLKDALEAAAVTGLSYELVS